MHYDKPSSTHMCQNNRSELVLPYLESLKPRLERLPMRVVVDAVVKRQPRRIAWRSSKFHESKLRLRDSVALSKLRRLDPEPQHFKTQKRLFPPT